MKKFKLKLRLQFINDRHLHNRWEFGYIKRGDYCFSRLNDQPARFFLNGSKQYFIDGKLHRENNKPAVIWWDKKRNIG